MSWAVVGLALDDLGIAGNTIVIYTTDNGPHSSAGRATSSPIPCRMRSSADWTGCRPCSPPRAIPTSSRSCPYLTGQEPKSPRREFFYFSDDGDALGMRYDNWKFVSAEQRMPGTLAVWSEPFTRLRGGKMFDLRADPYERADITSNTYYDWQMDHLFLVVPSQAYTMQFIETFKEFPPRQRPATFGIDQALETLQKTAVGP